ncbi:MAG: hypothetical protein BRD55_10835 [Bacteroidetes bacterium SW_9_63_38]|nr:MAG: hypothetical protein BRD55_10835 [Bacteroidetes bacterium SW_9_63_38]
MLIKWIFVLLHIITAAAWFGIGIRLTGQARSVLEHDGDARRALVDEGSQSVRLMNVFIVLTLVFSLSAFVAGGHFATYGPAYHSAVTLIVLLTIDQLWIIRGGWSALDEAVDTSDTNALASAKKRVAIGTGVGHLLWLVLLGLMFVNQFQAAFAAL